MLILARGLDARAKTIRNRNRLLVLSPWERPGEGAKLVAILLLFFVTSRGCASRRFEKGKTRYNPSP